MNSRNDLGFDEPTSAGIPERRGSLLKWNLKATIYGVPQMQFSTRSGIV